MNDNNNEINQEKKVAPIAPTKDFFKDVVADLPEDKVKKEIPNLDKASKNDTIEPVKTATDQEKINAYDNLEVKNLPKDWPAQLLRKNHLENKLATFTQIETYLKGWTDTFGEKNPSEVQAEITQLETKQKNTEETLNAKIKELEADLDKSIKESQKNALNSIEKIKALETELAEWKQTWPGKGLKEIKEEWDFLQQRPDIAVSTEEFYQNYALRPSLDKYNELNQVLVKEQVKVKQLQEKNKSFKQIVDQFIENEKTKKYILADPVVNPQQAEQAIAKLLEDVKKRWENYLNSNGDIIEQELKLILTLTDQEKKSRAYQIIAWIEEAQTTRDYQTLFERWSGATIYNKECDYDAGSLYLLGKYLEINNNQSINTFNHE